jgi:hypothetical protein
MSILQRLLNQETTKSKKLFGVIAGRRTSGKTTLAGTIPGNTLLLQAGVLESGSLSAEVLAKQNGHAMTVVNFHSIADLAGVLGELREDTTFDNIYIDSITAITELKYNEPEVQKTLKKDNWAAFREIGKSASDILLAAKSLTYNDHAKKAKNVFITCALEIKSDAIGNVTDVTLLSKGNKALSDLTKLGEAVVTVVQVDVDGEQRRKLLTKTANFFPGRIDSLLDDKNPGMIDADLSKLLSLIGA